MTLNRRAVIVEVLALVKIGTRSFTCPRSVKRVTRSATPAAVPAQRGFINQDHSMPLALLRIADKPAECRSAGSGDQTVVPFTLPSHR